MNYFLDRKGVATQRVAGRPGCGHIEIAMAAERLDPDGDIYQQMFVLGYARVKETDTEILVDAPHALTPAQKRVLATKESAGKQVKINDVAFVATRG